MNEEEPGIISMPLGWCGRWLVWVQVVSGLFGLGD